MSTESLLAEILAELKKLNAAAERRAATRAAASEPDAATEDELAKPYADETVKFLPRDYAGPLGFKGRKMSECPPELLDALASSFDYFASKNEKSGAVTDKGKPKADFDRASARRARGWAKRLRSGWKPKPPPSAAQRGFDDDAIVDESFGGDSPDF